MSFWNDPSNLLPKQAHRWVISFGGKNYSESTNAGENAINTYFAKSVERPSYDVNVVTYKENYTYDVFDPQNIVWKPITIVFYDVQQRDYDITKYNKIYKKEFFKTNQGLKNINYPHGKDIKKEEEVRSDGQQLKTNNYVNNKKTTTSRTANEPQQAFRSTQMFFYKFLDDVGYINSKDISNPGSRFRQGLSKNNFKTALIGNSDYLEIKELSDETFGSGNNKKDISKEIWKLYNPVVKSVSFDKLDYAAEDILKITVLLQYDWAILEGNNKDGIIKVYPEGFVAEEQKFTATIPSLPLPKISVNRKEEEKSLLDKFLNLFKTEEKQPLPSVSTDLGTPKLKLDLPIPVPVIGTLAPPTALGQPEPLPQPASQPTPSKPAGTRYNKPIPNPFDDNA